VPLGEIPLDSPHVAVNDHAEMGLLVVLGFSIPLFVGLAVVGVKTLEFALNRDIASSKVVARWTTLLVVGTAGLGVVAWLVYLAIKLSGDPS
jgi:hypothetical protein